MIDYPDQEFDRLIDPGVPDDMKWLADQNTHWMKKVYDALRRQESPNPTRIRLNPGVIQNQQTARMRCYALVFSGGTASSNLGLKVGTAVVFDWIVGASPGPVVYPLSEVFDAGVDISVVDLTTPGSINWRAHVLAYVELEDGNA